MKLKFSFLLYSLLNIILIYGASYKEVYDPVIQAVLEQNKRRLRIECGGGRSCFSRFLPLKGNHPALYTKLSYNRSLLFFVTDPKIIRFLQEKGLRSDCDCCRLGFMHTEHADTYGKRPCDYTAAQKEEMRQGMLHGVFVGVKSK
jgi:hypothetical protein